MNLPLDYEQRLYLFLMLGNLECRTVSETRSAWELMDRLELKENEKAEIDFKVQIVDQQEAFSWNLSKAPASAREFYFSEPDIKRLAIAVAACPKFVPRQARRWLEPLLQVLPELEETSNGNRAAVKP